MLLTPSAAKPWLAPDVRNRPWPGHGAMMIRRREALAALVPAYGSWSRLALGALAWAGAAAGVVLLGRAFLQVLDAVDRLVEQRTLPPQRLGPLRIVPDVRVLQFALYFLQALALGIVVKDTPSALPAGPAGRRCAGGRD